MRNLCLFLLALFASSHAFGKNLSSQTILDLFTDNYEGVITTYELEGDGSKTSAVTLLIVAKAYENTEDYDQALKIYDKMIRRYSSFHEAVRKSIKNPDMAPELEKGNILAYVYYQMARVYTQKYLETSQLDPKSEREKLKNNVTIYTLLSERANGPIVAIDELRFKVSEREGVLKAKTYQTHYYTYLGFMTWQDKLKLEGQSGDVDILNTSEGSCLGLGVKTYNVNRLYGFDICYMTGKSTSSSLMNDVVYEQSDVSTNGIFANFETAWQVFSDHLWIGPSLPIFYRKGTWSAPESFEFRQRSYLRTGLLLSTTWEVGRFSFTSRFGKIFDNKSSHLQIYTSYRF